MSNKLTRFASCVALCAFLSTALVASASAAPCRIQAFGDSITAGVGSFFAPGGYRAFLVAQPPNVGGIQMVGQHIVHSPQWMIDLGQAWNSSAPGYRTDQLVAFTNPGDPVTPVLPQLPDVILVHVGTNDIAQFQGGQNATVDLNVLLDSLLYWHYHVWNNPVTVLVAKIIPMRGAYDGLNPQVNLYNSQIDAIAAARRFSGYDVHVVDQHTGFDKVLDMADDLHPNDNGYAKMATRWRAMLELVGCP